MIKRSKKHSRREKEQRTLRRFVEVYCHRKHGFPDGELCGDCSDLLGYALKRLEKCPLKPKPKCKDCTVHCFTKQYRKRIQEVMKFAGMHFVKRGRLDWLVRYFSQ